MKKSNRKGFTIVELVIVIAVIAILAAVLIPTFSNLIKKANESSDVQAVRQMNTILAAENAFAGGITINDAVKALEEAGFNGDKYVPLVSGHYFFYDQDTKQIVYTEYKDGKYNVLFPKDATIEGHALFSLSGDVAKKDYAAPAISEDGKTATFSIGSAEEFAQLAADFKALTDGGELENFTTTEVDQITCVTGKHIVINLGGNIDMKGAAFNLNIMDCDFTLNGKGYTISGVVNNSGFALSAQNEEKKTASYGGAFLGYVVNSKVDFNDVTFENCHFGNDQVKASAIFIGQFTAKGKTATFNNTKVVNCTVNGLKGVAVYVGHSRPSGVANITFSGSNEVVGCKLNASATAEKTPEDANLVGTIIGRITGTTNVSGAAPSFAEVSITSGGNTLDVAGRDIINASKMSDADNIVVPYTGTSWTNKPNT